MQIHSYLKTSLIDYPGHLAAVVFSYGCNWNCWYCLNQEILKTEGVKVVPEKEVLDFLDERKGFLDGVVLCGGEPTLQPDLISFAKKVKQMGYDVKLDTNGTNPDVLKKMVEEKLVDYVAMDIKAPFSKYESVIGVKTSMDKVMESIEFLRTNAVDYEFRTTCAPTLLKEDLIEIAHQIAGAKRLFLQRFVVPERFSEIQFKCFSEKELEEIAKECSKYIKTAVR